MTLDDWGALARTPAGLALTLAIGVLYPLIGWFRFRRLEQRPDPLPRREKLALYASIVVSQWTLVAAAGLVLGGSGRSLGDIGLGPGVDLARTAVVTVVLLAAFAVLSWFTTRSLAIALDGDLPPHVRRAGRILPRDGVELAGFVPVAITAGVCEEILYRGWLPWALAGSAGSVLVGFVVAAAVFGLGHLYQGRNGVALTGLLGLALGATAWWTGSVIPGQALHVAVDLVNGAAVGAALTRMSRVSAPVAPPAGVSPEA
jgi:membrane protease YdiL (CAAX protease family)